jgi:hypothetical protein
VSGGAVGLGEAHARRRQARGVRRYARVIRPHDIRLLLVGHEDEDIRTMSHVRSLKTIHEFTRTGTNE